jgi:Phage integrase, N-terminal SAM-like domain
MRRVAWTPPHGRGRRPTPSALATSTAPLLLQPRGRRPRNGSSPGPKRPSGTSDSIRRRFKDGGGKRRWHTVAGGITAARALRDELLARRGRGERVVSDGRLRFANAAAKWLAGPVLDLRARTQECYRNAIEQHLIPAFGARRLDAISPDDVALLVRELRSRGFSESTIVIVLGVTIACIGTRLVGSAGPGRTLSR